MNRKIYTFFAIILIIFPLSYTYALTASQKGAIMEKFKKKQYDLLFESDILDDTSRFTDIFNISKKVDIYSNIGKSNQDLRKEAEEKHIETLNKINSLEESIKQLDNDISKTLANVKNINNRIIAIKREIEINTKTIEIIKKKIEENTEIMMDYLVYIYKKGNTVFDNNKVDNLKSIILNGDNIADLLNDLYYKGIIQIAGKKLIDNHRKYITDLYIKKVKLRTQEKNLKTLRKMGIIEKKVLADKKSYKEKILKISKGKQTYYSKYINNKLAIEKRLKLKEFKEKVKFNAIKNEILKKYNCKFVDVSKNTAEVRALSGKCLNINKMIYSESKLNKTSKDFEVSFNWPVQPTMGISAYFHDPEYKKYFGVRHDAIDIVAPQGTPIKAPADGYVVHITPPDSDDYAYVAIKHFDGYLTVYGHISDVFVKEFDFVKKGEVFAQTGGEFGTLGAGYMTTGPHLHFEVFKDKKYIDPLTVLDLSYIQFTNLPEKYEFKYYLDFKKRKGYEFKNKKTRNSRVFKLKGDTEIERQKYLINTYASPAFRNWQMWVQESLEGNIDPSFVMCIGLAETTLGNNLASAYNVGNVGNNDRGDRKQLTSARQGIYLIIHTLNNKYFKDYNTVGEMSGAGREVLGLSSCREKGTYCYATDTKYWHKNVIKCMSHLKGTYIPDNYNFRITK
ncbi:peptidoglycan DD-metalloendopeptidase family protein [Candidatus Gracilibacteria bacterium]|nr:peptidoglycan DD-metalloendopeptidase family protein [Candidatus Gracilibacteria bacterium]